MWPTDFGDMLTERQKEILCRLGLSNRQIASSLGITESTVKNHLKEIYGRLPLGFPGSNGHRCTGDKRTKALAVCVLLGIVPISEIVTDPRKERALYHGQDD